MKKGSVMTFAPLCLLLCWMLPVESNRTTSPPETNPIIEMSMVDDAEDDMYSGCSEMMTKMINDNYFEKENTESFADIWKNAEHCANKKLRHLAKGDEALTKNHMQAICVYTSEYEQFYTMFNRMNRNSTYFPYHALHFWLTSALQILNNEGNCYITYRRANAEFTGNVSQTIRFGFFASSSYKTTLTHFGQTTCFKIKTCSGAYLKHYSSFGKSEREVLIPPYETFKITKKTKGSRVKGLRDCEVVYFLESAGVRSNLNCNATSERYGTSSENF